MQLAACGDLCESLLLFADTLRACQRCVCMRPDLLRERGVVATTEQHDVAMVEEPLVGGLLPESFCCDRSGLAKAQVVRLDQVMQRYQTEARGEDACGIRARERGGRTQAESVVGAV